MASAYEGLVHRLHRIQGLGEASKILGWDQETYMPPGGVEPRAMSLGVLSGLSHELFTSDETGRLLAEAEKSETDEVRRALLRETRVAYDRATRVPTPLVEALTRASSRGQVVWREARAGNDFPRFRPVLEEIVDLRRKYAEAIDPDKPAYEVLFQDYEPWIPLAQARENLARLREGLLPLVQEAATAPPAPDLLSGEWPRDRQEALSREVLRRLGYDFRHGRLDVSTHPFSTGNPYDARITTRYDEADPLSGLLSTIHEAGHAMYEQGLPREHFGTPLGEAQGLIIHESQSRLWENHVGRSLPFWEHLLPLVGETFPGKLDGATPRDVWRAVNRVQPSLIRVEADELTYHMHIALRFELEEGMIGGAIPIREVPAAWNERVARYLGLTPPDDARGCLQDIHWSMGAVGYFPTYSLGSILSAQLFEAFEKETGPAGPRLAAGDFAPLLAWLREKVHRHGKRYPTDALIQGATGRPLSPEAFLRYARTKFSEVWKK